MAIGIDGIDAPSPASPPPAAPDYSAADQPVVDEGKATPDLFAVGQDSSAQGTDELQPSTEMKLHTEGDAGDSKLLAVLDQPEIKSALDQAWQDSKPGDYDSRHEEGGWIIHNDVTGEARMERVNPGMRDGMSSGQPPDVGENESVIGFARTHPNPQVDEIGNRYNPGMSNTDRVWAENYQIPMVVRNANDTYVYFPRSAK